MTINQIVRNLNAPHPEATGAPPRATLANVAEALGCSQGWAGELLRKAGYKIVGKNWGGVEYYG